jgi:AraC family transcriptional regulator of adaptative response/methylated-DNA-[protein]-cysteine methyltransferase
VKRIQPQDSEFLHNRSALSWIQLKASRALDMKVSMKNTSPTPNHGTDTDPRWLAVLARDPAADTQFVYAVKTTGVYCRPSSPSRLPRRENVEFFDSAEQAEAAGYRASKRAAADQTLVAEQHAALVTKACQLIEQAEGLPLLNELAEHVGLSPFHFHRVFKATTGLTPKAYATAHRARKMRQQLEAGGSVTDALYDAGFNSNSRFYESSNGVLGMKPGEYRAGGANTDIRFAVGQCSLGAILVAQSTRGICAILLGDDPDALVRDLQDKFARTNLIGGDHDFEQLVAKVVGFIEAPAIGLDLPLDLQGTAFQERVWQALRSIPVGTTASYGEIAALIGAPKSFRAVAQACGANSLAVAIPCHRVVRSDGHLSGYRWGVERKRILLDREAT